MGTANRVTGKGETHMTYVIDGRRTSGAWNNVLFGFFAVHDAGLPAHKAVRNMPQLMWHNEDDLDTTTAEHRHDV